MGAAKGSPRTKKLGYEVNKFIKSGGCTEHLEAQVDREQTPALRGATLRDTAGASASWERKREEFASVVLQLANGLRKRVRVYSPMRRRSSAAQATNWRRGRNGLIMTSDNSQTKY